LVNKHLFVAGIGVY